MNLPHDQQLCTVCRQRPRWAVRWACKPCYLALRADLRELVDAHRRLGEAMVVLPPAWRTSAIRAVRSVESPIPFDPELALQREQITDTLAYWARMVLDAMRPRPWPPGDVTVEALTEWLARHLGWITRNPAVGELAGDVRGLCVHSDQLVPRWIEGGDQIPVRLVERRKLPLPCPSCDEISLTQRGDLVECVRGTCSRRMLLSSYHRLEAEVAERLAQDTQAAA